jgi:putative protease
VRIGTVVEVTARGVVVALADELSAACDARGPLPIKPGDGVVFDEGHPEQDEQGGRIFSISEYGPPRAAGLPAAAEQDRTKEYDLSESPGSISSITGTPQLRHAPARHELTFGRGAVNLAAVAVGATLWKTDDPALRKRLEQTWATEEMPQRTPLTIEVRGVAGFPLDVSFRDNAGYEAIVQTDQAVQTAIKHPLTRALLDAQLGRLGGTPFRIDRIELSGADGPAEQLPVMVPKSVLNELRRRGVAELIERRRSGKRPWDVNANALGELRSEVEGLPARDEFSEPNEATARILNAARRPEKATFSLLCRTLSQVDSALSWKPTDDLPKPSLLYCDFEEVRLSKEAVARCRSAGMPVALATPRVLKPGEEGLLLQVARCAPDGVLVRNLAAVSFFRERFPELSLYGDYSLNVTNELTAALFIRQGLVRLTPGYDLNASQLEALLSRIDPGSFEVVLHQHIPMFHMEHCVFSHVLSNGRDFHDCGRPCDRHRVELRDHVGEAHPLLADVGCRNTVFAARAQSAAPYVPRLRERGVRHFRVELLREDTAETQTLIASYARVLAGIDQGPSVWHALQVLNQIGLTRGTLEFE